MSRTRHILNALKSSALFSSSIVASLEMINFSNIKLSQTSSDEEKEADLCVLARQTFKDMGFKGPVYIAFEPYSSPGVTTFFDKNFNRAARLIISTSFLSSYKLNEWRAIFAHEAVHAKYEDNKVKIFSSSFIFFTMLLLKPCHISINLLMSTSSAYFFCKTLGRYDEKRADLVSAKTLGISSAAISALLNFASPYSFIERNGNIYLHSIFENEFTDKCLSNFIKENQHKKYSFFKNLFQSHPHDLERISYLKKLRDESQPRFSR